MPIRSVLAIDVDDSAFRQFHALFEKYQQAVQKLPGAWRAVGAQQTAGRSEMVDMAAALMAQAELLHKARNESEKIEHSFTRASSAMSSIGRATKSVVSDLASMSLSILKWSGITSLATGIVGAGGLWGLNRLAEHGSGILYGARGLGISPAQYEASTALSPVVGNPRAFMGQLQELLQSAQGKAALVGAGVGAFPGGNPFEVMGGFLRSVQDLVKRSDPAFLATILESRQLGGIVPLGMANRLGKMTPQELDEWVAIAKRQQESLSTVSEANLIKWAKLNLALDQSWQKIEDTFINKLTSIAPELTKLSDKISDAVVAFIKGPGFSKLVDTTSGALERFAKYVGTEEFATDVTNFVTNIGILAKAVTGAVEWFASHLHAIMSVGGAGVGAALGSIFGPLGAIAGGAGGFRAGSDLYERFAKGLSGGGSGSVHGLDKFSYANKQIEAIIASATSAEIESSRRIMTRESRGNPNIGYTPPGSRPNDLTNAPRDQWGFPQWAGAMGPAGISHAAGLFQFEPKTWREAAQALGIHDFSTESQFAARLWTLRKYGEVPWAASEPRGGGSSRATLSSAMSAGSQPYGSEGSTTFNKHGEQYVMRDGIWQPASQIPVNVQRPHGVSVRVEYEPGASPAQAAAAVAR